MRIFVKLYNVQGEYLASYGVWIHNASEVTISENGITWPGKYNGDNQVTRSGNHVIYEVDTLPFTGGGRI